MPEVMNSEAASPGERVEDLASDVRGILASEDLDSVPHIKALRERVDAKLAIARELAAEEGRRAAMKARETALATNTYAHEHPYRVASIFAALGILVGLAFSDVFAHRLPGEPTTPPPLKRKSVRR